MIRQGTTGQGTTGQGTTARFVRLTPTAALMKLSLLVTLFVGVLANLLR